MTTEDQKISGSNTLIITDRDLLNANNSTILSDTISLIRTYVNKQNIEDGVHCCFQFIHLKSFKRILLLFSSNRIAGVIHDFLHGLNIKISFARHNNKLDTCDFDTCDTTNAQSEVKDETILSPQDIKTDLDYNERCPDASVQQEKGSKRENLCPPTPHIQMQSPPPSPYEGWIERPEDPPSNVSYGFNPRTLSHILYTTGEDERDDLKRVFTPNVESRCDQEQRGELEFLSLGEGVNDSDEEEESLLQGSLFQKQNQNRTVGIESPTIPIFIIDNEEAKYVKTHAEGWGKN